jgi:DNA-directed RNA polymerase subunit M/transcription elongation factor TFIIS
MSHYVKVYSRKMGEMFNIEVPDPCPNCGESDHELLLWQEDENGDMTEYVECEVCKTQYLSSRAIDNN